MTSDTLHPVNTRSGGFGRRGGGWGSNPPASSVSGSADRFGCFSPESSWFGGGNGEPPPLCPAARMPQLRASPRPIQVPKHAGKAQRSSSDGPEAKPASPLGCSENRVHWKSARLQYIGISICQLLNSKTDCLKTEPVSHSKFTLNSSPFLHL